MGWPFFNGACWLLAAGCWLAGFQTSHVRFPKSQSLRLALRNRKTIVEQLRLRIQYQKGVLAFSLTELESYKTDLGLNWRPTRWFRPGVGYRLSMKVDKYGDFNPFHRFHVQNQAKIRLGPLALSYRFRYQDQLSFEKELTEHKHTVRNRFKVKGKVPWALAPSLEVEGYTRLYETPFYALKKLRVTTGIEWQMTRQHAIHPYYRIQIPMDDPNDPIEYIVGLSYVFVIE